MLIKILVSVVVAVAVGAYRYDRMTLERLRLRNCGNNRKSIDRCVAMWEAENLTLDPAKGDLWIDVDTAGEIAAVSSALATQMDRSAVRVADRLQRTSGVFHGCMKDTSMFHCPLHVPAGVEVHYRWTFLKAPSPELNGFARGTLCRIHDPHDGR